MVRRIEHLGFPPNDLIEKSSRGRYFFERSHGKLLVKDGETAKEVLPKSKRLDHYIVDFFEDTFYNFFKKSLDMNPRTRFTAQDLLNHPWLNEGCLTSSKEKEPMEGQCSKDKEPIKCQGSKDKELTKCQSINLIICVAIIV